MPNATDDYIRQHDHETINAQLQEYLQRGGTIETIPRGVSGMQDGLYGAMGRQIRNSMKASTKKLYDDVPDQEEIE